MTALDLTADDGRPLGRAELEPEATPRPRATLTLAEGADPADLARATSDRLGGHRVAVGDAGLAAALEAAGAAPVRASALMVLPLPAATGPPPDGVVVSPVCSDPMALGEAMRRAYPPGHPDHDHGDVTAEGAAATIGSYLAGEVGTGPFLADASGEARDGDGDGTLLGAVFISEQPGDDLVAGPWVVDVFVDPAAHGRGVGRALLHHSADRLAAAGRGHLGLAVTLGNPAHALYERLGFEIRRRRWTLDVP